MAHARPVMVAVAIALALAGVGALRVHPAPPASKGLTAAQRSGSLQFAADVHPVDRQAVLDAIARARPEAQRLIEVVDGAVTVRVGATGAQTAGYTRSGPGGYEVVLDLGSVSRRMGARGITRLVLHELAHVVDHALVPAQLAHTLAAAVPLGYACEPGARDAACAAREERFAETFAKWATGDIGEGLYIGYRVLPPPSLEQWGRPLAGLAT